MMLHTAYTVYTHIVYVEFPHIKSTNYWVCWVLANLVTPEA